MFTVVGVHYRKHKNIRPVAERVQGVRCIRAPDLPRAIPRKKIKIKKKEAYPSRNLEDFIMPNDIKN